jgi:malonyl-CoA O-methyltransferase
MPLSKPKIVQRFNKSAPVYDQFAQLQQTMGQQLISELQTFAADRKTTARIADLGCGTGTMLESLVEEGYLQLSGFDIAHAMLVQAAEKCPAFVSLNCGDIESLPAKDNFFDIVVSNAAIQWCQTDLALSEMARVLKPQGIALITTFGPATLHQWRTAFADMTDASHHTQSDRPTSASRHRIHQLDSIDQIRQAIDRSGMVAKRMDTNMTDVSFDSVRSMFDSVRKIGATNAQYAADVERSTDAPELDATPLSKSDYRSIVSSFQRTIDAGNRLVLTYEVITIVAQKS